MNLNKDFLISMQEVLSKQDFDKFLLSLEEKPKRGLVVNNFKINTNIFLKEFNYPLKQLPFDDNSFLLDSEEKLGNSLLHKVGAFYLQEPSAMLPGLMLPLKEGDIVLDACASPGGKTFQIAKRLQGVLISNEIDFERAKKLQSNVERLGLTNTIITNFSSKQLAENYPNCFDAILVDAPCSGEGMFRRDSLAVNQWNKKLVDDISKTQLEILTNLDCCLKENGYLIYSTCTFSLEENEKMLVNLVNMGYEILPLKNINGCVNGVKIKGYNTDYSKRVYPHNDLGEGQFVCLLQKRTECVGKLKEYNLKNNVNDLKIVNEFLNTNLEDCNILENIVLKDKIVYYSPNRQLLRNSNIVSCGVRLGSIEKNRFEPHHNFFTVFGHKFKRKLDLVDEEVLKVMQGQTINKTYENGWLALSFKGCYFAGGKAVNGVIKNHYPKGLRVK